MLPQSLTPYYTLHKNFADLEDFALKTIFRMVGKP